MPRATRAGSSSKKNVPDKFIDKDGFLSITGETFWKHRALDSDVQRNSALLLEVGQAIQKYVDEHADFKALMQKKADLVTAQATAINEMTEFNTQLQKDLEGVVDLNKCAIDDKTGRIHLLEAGENQVPIPVKSKKTKK